MVDPHIEADLDALFAMDAPPAHDADFVVAVAQRVSRRRLLLDLAAAAFLTAVVSLILWALAPLLTPMLEPIGKTLLVATPAVVIAGMVLFLVHPRTSLI